MADPILVEVLRRAIAEDDSQRASLADLIIADSRNAVIEVVSDGVVDCSSFLSPSAPFALPRASEVTHNGWVTNNKEGLRVRKKS